MDTMFRCKRCGKIQWSTIQKHSCGSCDKPQKCSCSGLLVQMTVDEIKDEQERQKRESAENAKEIRENSTLPKWCLSAISLRAYEDGHSSGQQEVDGIEVSMIYDFEQAMKKELDDR